MGDEPVSIAALSEERLRLEREAFEIERSRLEAARARAESELRQARAGHPFLVFSSVTLLALLSVLGGVLTGMSVSEGRQQRQRDARLREALSQISGLAEVAVTNATAIPAANGRKPSGGASRDVAVVVIQ